jgi:protein involved in polysaccharide export with SLBB domain
MSKQLVLILGIFLAAFSPLAPAQSLSGSTSPTSDVDCSDPTMASSSACSVNQQTINPSGSQGGGQFGNFPSATTPRSSVQQPQSFSDNGGLGNQNQNVTNRIPLPPEPLTEFQKFVASTTGQILPIFGESLFRYVPSTFAPLDQVPVPPDYVLGPGDELRIRAWGQVNFNADVRVDRQGEIYLPQVGTVHVAGLPYQALDQHIRESVGRIFRNFDLIADVGQIRAIQVYIVGQAHRPGTYTISSLSTLVDAIFASGGPSVQGSMRHILLKRNGGTVVDFDLYDLLLNGDKSKDAKLQSGDVIFIPAVGPVVAFTGSVRRPAIYELRGETTIDELLKTAGGASAVAAGARISIERIQNREDRLAMEVGFDAAGLATTVHDGDLLRVLSITPMYQKTVTLRGNTANPGRFAWHEGMRLSELIPDKDSLLTRNYWWRRTQLGLPAPEFQPIPALSAQSQPTNPVDLRNRTRNYPAYNPYLRNFPDCNTYNPNNPNAFGCNQFDNLGIINSNSSNAGQDYSYQGVNNYNNISPYNYNNYNYPPPPDQDIFSGQEDIYPQGGSQSGGNGQYQQSQSQPGGRQLQANQQGMSSALGGPGSEVITQNTAGVTQRMTVTLPAPEIDWDYAVIERLDPVNLKTSLIPFDLERPQSESGSAGWRCGEHFFSG